MVESFDKMNPMFLQLVLSLQASAMQQMGKVVSSLTGKVERDLNMARNSIDLLGMFEEKTKGNLSEEEEKILGHVLYELRLNYADEAGKGDTAEEKAEEPEVAPSGEAPPGDTEPPDQKQAE